MTKTKKVDLLSFSVDDNGNAECMKALHGEELIYCSALGWMLYTGTHWERQEDDAAARRFAVDTLRRRAHAAISNNDQELLKKSIPDDKRVTSCIAAYKSLVGVNIQKPDIFDKDPDLLNCLNGVVNLRTGSLEQHKPCQYFTYCIPVEYKPDADMSLWNDFIHQSVSSEEMAHYLQKLVGYSFTGHTREQILIYLHGPTRAGKGTFTGTLLHLLGSPFASGADFNTFSAPRDHDTQNFDLAPLKPARFIVASESNTYQRLNSAKVKQATGEDPLNASFKHKTPFTFIPQFKIWLVSNNPVNGDPGDDALWVRIQVVKFPFSHVGEEDKTLREKLRLTENMEGVLRWAVEGAMKWYAEGLGTPPSEVTEATNKQRDDQDYVKQWINDEPCLKEKGEVVKTLFESDDWESTADLMQSFKQWCIENNVKPVAPNQFAPALRRLGLSFTRKGKTGNRGYILSRRQTPADANIDHTAPLAHGGDRSNVPSAPSARLPENIEQPQQNGNGHITSAKEALEMVYAMGEGYLLTIGEDGILRLGVPTDLSDERYNELVEQVAPYASGIVKLLKERESNT